MTRRRRVRPGRIIASAVAILVSLAWVFPVYWMLNSSLLPNAVLTSTSPRFLPFGGSLDNFSAVFDQGTFWPALGMSLAITLTTVAFCLFIAQYKLMSSLNLLNSVIGVAILYVAAVVPFTIWMLRGFVAGVPIELEEAAMVDGLSRTQAFFRITFPLLAPGLVASGVYAFLQAWNEFTVALVILQKEEYRTLPLWLRGFVQASANRATDWGQVMAASTLVAVPVIIFFLIVQGRLTSGLVAGAVKG